MIHRDCEQCGDGFATWPNRIRRGFGRFCSRACGSASHRVERTIHPNGYIMLKRPEHQHAGRSGFVYEHVLVIEEYLGRRLRRGEVVHHRNGDPTDNRIENLEVTTQSLHAAHHMRERAIADGVADPENFKRCPQCKQIKRRTEFSTHGKTGCISWCKPCCVIGQRKRRAREAA